MHLSRSVHAVVIVVWAAAVALFWGCEGRSARSEKPLVACTIFPLTSVVQQIVGPDVEVATLVPAGVSPHGFEPTGRQVEAMQSAWLIVSVGLGYDEWAHTAGERAGIPVVEMGDLVTLPKSALEAGPGAPAEDDHAGHHHAVANPHIWIDPALMIEFVARVSPRLVEAVGRKEQIEANAAKLIAELQTLDAELRDKLAPFRGAKLVTYHNAFDLLAQRYGLEVAATLTPTDSPAGMTPRKLEQAIAVIKQFGVKAVFAEPQFPVDVGRVVQQETGVKVLTLDALGDPNDPPRSSYQSLLRYNLWQLLEGLGETPGKPGG